MKSNTSISRPSLRSGPCVHAQPWVVAIVALQRATLPCTARCRSLRLWRVHRSGSLSLASAPPLARRSLSSGARPPLRVAGAPWCIQAVCGACLPAPLNAPLTSLSLGSSHCITLLSRSLRSLLHCVPPLRVTRCVD